MNDQPTALAEIAEDVAHETGHWLSTHEEHVNAVIHGIGFALSLAAAGYIVWLAGEGDVRDAVACGVYALTLIAMYAVSALSHAVQHPPAKKVLRAWDQGMVYLLIVGTQTPLMWKYVPAMIFWPVLVLIWAAAAAGFYSKVFAHHRIDGKFSALSYLALGWVPAMILISYVPRGSMVWIAVGGVSYTVGVLFLTLDRRVRYFHAVWHLFVILGSACHYYAIIQYVMLQ